MLDHITYLFRLRTVVEEGSLRRAAEKLSITQPALTRSIQQLEKRFGQPLLERLPRGVTPTAFGQRVLSSVLRLGRHWELEEEALKSAGGALQGRFRLRAGPLYRAVVLPKIIGKLQAEFPHLVIEMQNSPRGHALQDLIEGRCDVLFGGLQIADQTDHRLATREFTVVHDRVVAREGHPLFQRVKAGHKLNPKMLLEYPWLIYTADVEYINATMHAPLERVGRSPEVRITCESLISAIALLQNTDCLSILPDAALDETRAPRIVPIPVLMSRRKVKSGAIYREEMQQWPPLAMLMQLCQERFGTPGTT